MRWRIGISKNADNFLRKNQFTEKEVFELIGKAISYFQREDVNVDIKKLTGEWAGFHRIRRGKIRIIAEFDFKNSFVFIEEIDWRGSAYK